MAKKMEDARVRRDVVEAGAREDRADSTQVDRTDDNLASAEQRRANLRNEWLYDALPRPPVIPGFHTCWLTTTNPSDSVTKRIRLGYALVRVDEVPEFEHLKMHSGQWEGCVSVNEMLLAKIPLEFYQEIMTEFHHNMPLEEEGRIRDMLTQMSEATRDSAGRKLVNRMEDGFESLGQGKVPNPVFQP